MKVNFGWSFMYYSRSSASSGNWKLLGQNLMVFGNVLRILLTIEQKVFFLASCSRPGYRLKYGVFFRFYMSSMSLGVNASPYQTRFPIAPFCVSWNPLISATNWMSSSSLRHCPVLRVNWTG